MSKKWIDDKKKEFKRIELKNNNIEYHRITSNK